VERDFVIFQQYFWLLWHKADKNDVFQAEFVSFDL
jgi:hypothetical protein